MATDSETAESVRALARRIGALRPVTDTQVANVGFMAGALYSLVGAVDLQYNDSRGRTNATLMAAEFVATLGATASAIDPPRAWLAGFYFHSATMGLAALNTRLGEARDVAKRTRRSVNSLKHDADAHISGLHTVTLEWVVLEATNLCELLEASMV